jgi:hypothetical protein
MRANQRRTARPASSVFRPFQQGHLCGLPVFEDGDEAVIIETGDATLKASLQALKPNHVAVLHEDREPSEALVPLLQSADALVCVGELHGCAPV